MLCHICGVSFNIGRIRRSDEPRDAAWSRFGGESFVTGNYNGYEGECPEDSGCCFTFRQPKDEDLYMVDSFGKRWLVPPARTPVHSTAEGQGGDEACQEDDGDLDYLDESSNIDEPLEYDSDAELLAVEEDGVHEDDAGLEDGDLKYRQFWNSSRQGSAAWHLNSSTGMEGSVSLDHQDAIFSLFTSHSPDSTGISKERRDFHRRWDVAPEVGDRDKDERHLGYKLSYYAGDEARVEHIAGSGCINLNGYSGHRITTEEMKRCLTSQSLVRKPPGSALLQYRPSFDDEPFEREGEFFLSGLSDHMPSRDTDCPHVYPPRHGCKSPLAENCCWSEEEAEEYSMPFHPPCLEIYKRASRLRLDVEEIEGLTDWFVMEGNYDEFRTFEQEVRDENVSRCSEQNWRHENGTEYLVANPLWVPELPTLLDQVVILDPSFNVRNGAFEIRQGGPTQTPGDPFNVLPHELDIEILTHLSSSDIARLRLASRKFRQLPIFLWHDLLMREMPWLWEIWNSTPYSRWACTSAQELEAADHRDNKAREYVRDYVRIVTEELPELTDTMNDALAAYEEKADQDARHASTVRPYHLPHDKTNWFALYTLVTRHMRLGNLKGLRNRRRVWKDCEEILRRIAKYREANQFPIIDVRAVLRASNERARARRLADEERLAAERTQAQEQKQRDNGVIVHTAAA